MFIYYCLYACIGFTAIITQRCKTQQQKNRIMCWTCFTLITLLLSLRHETMGADLIRKDNYSGYLYQFDKLGQMSWIEVLRLDSYVNYERGFILFNKLIHFLSGGSRQIFLAVCAVLSILPLALVYDQKSPSPALSFIIYLGLPIFLMTFSGLRQSIAIAICLYSVLMIQKRKPFFFALLILLASAFHWTAWVFLVAYPVYHIKLNFGMRIFSAFLAPAVYVMRYPLFKLLSGFFKENVTVDNNNSITLLLVFFAIYFFCIFFYDESEEQNGYLNLFFLAILCQTFGGLYSTAIRIGYYFMSFLPLLLPLSISGMKKKSDRTLITFVIMVCFVVFGLFCFSKDSFAETNPYYFFWEQV